MILITRLHRATTSSSVFVRGYFTCMYQSTVGSAEVATELEPTESIKNSSIPRSPLDPILRWPYPSGAPEEVRSLSFWGREKKASASASSLSKRPAGMPWLTALKKPSLPQALATAPAEPGDDRSTTGTATETSGLVAVSKAVMAGRPRSGVGTWELAVACRLAVAAD